MHDRTREVGAARSTPDTSISGTQLIARIVTLCGVGLLPPGRRRNDSPPTTDPTVPHARIRPHTSRSISGAASSRTAAPVTVGIILDTMNMA